MPYIKSHSNYVLQQKHQNIKDGTIYERDITTIGGVDQFGIGQTPIYRSNNFIITVRNDGKPSNQYNTSKWKENSASGEVWTLQSISSLSSSTVEDNDTKIVLKQDYYDLNDFAYYGSLTELFRASVTDIVSRFPGELYVTDKHAYYTSAYTEDGERIEDDIQLGGSNDYYVDNPFGINIYVAIKPSDATNPLKFFAEEGYKNYSIIDESGNTSGITDWESEWYYSELNPSATSINDKYINYSASTNGTIASGITSVYKPCKGDIMANVSISANNKTVTIKAYLGDNNDVIYLSDKQGYHIRANDDFLNDFYNECDNFEKLLMDKDTDYTATFSVIRENEYGYYRELVPFKFPTTYGGYNIDTSDYGFNAYTQQMVEVGEYYDENFSDNLWRSMTHEAIKNFDWTYTREFNEGDEEEYVFGGQRIQKALRIFAREFDEILSYINNIKNGNRITYDERNNLPDYFLTDAVENSGWNVELVYPYTLTEKNLSGIVIADSAYTECNGENCMGQLNNTDNSGNTIIREFSQNANTKLKPYAINSDDYGYFNICCYGGSILTSSGETDTIYYDPKALGGKGATKDVVRYYSDSKEWTYQQCNNEFLRRLKINSPYIWRNKGTVEGIEMILGMFGLKSERWLKAKGDKRTTPDFKVTEYSSFTYRVEEPWDAVHQDYRINWLNSTKTIAYDNRSTSNYNKYGMDVQKIPYQGIPVSYRDEYDSCEKKYIKKSSLNDQILSGVSATSNVNECFLREDGTPVVRRYLYPNFDRYEQLDGNPYFQMDGGWQSKIINSKGKKYNFQYDVDNNIVYSNYGDSGETLYKETVRNIRRVDDVNGLLSILTNELYDGVICNVTRVEEDSAVIDGVVYPIHKEWYSDSSQTVSYVSFIKSDGYIKVGNDKFFDTSIIVYDIDNNESMISIEDKSDGYEVKAYISGDSFICKEDEEGNYTISNYVNLSSAWTNNDDTEYTNYFVLDNVNYASEISKWDDSINGYTSGWKRLSTTDGEYIKINTIVNDNKGNNPHNGNMVYDNGHEYFTYFKRIFKHAADNELFDTRCYDDFYDTLDNEISKYGFSGLINDDESILNYDKFLIKDSKIHYFGNYKKKDENDNIDKIWIYGKSEKRLNGFKKVYSNETSDVVSYILTKINDDGWIENNNPYAKFEKDEEDEDEVTNQIVNSKRFKINFNLHDDWYTRSGQEEIKYLDTVVMNYLTQMIPSTTIFEVEYSHTCVPTSSITNAEVTSIKINGQTVEAIPSTGANNVTCSINYELLAIDENCSGVTISGETDITGLIIEGCDFDCVDCCKDHEIPIIGEIDGIEFLFKVKVKGDTSERCRQCGCEALTLEDDCSCDNLILDK